MGILRKSFLVLVGLVVVLVGVGLLLPRQVEVERSIVIAAEADEIFPYINSLEKFNEWSPWGDYDPDTVYTFSGPDTGTGARVDWTSDHANVGDGSQEIIASVENKSVKTELDFGMDGVATAVFLLNRVETGTEVTWGFTTEMGMNPIGRYFGLMMDKWVGGDYEKGLAALKVLVEDGE